ncbi:MAG: glycerophosphodiester phosphodiesterase [Vicinamibacterales bacterium]
MRTTIPSGAVLPWLAALAAAAVPLLAATRPPQAPARPFSAAGRADAIIIGHRGASGHRPEHTMASYTLAIEQGADFIEPDLVSTKDGVLVARHENEIGSTTDAAEKFPARRRTAVVDGETITGWFVEDFTLEEVRTLRAKERLPSRSQAYNGQFGIPTFDEVVALAQAQAAALGRPIGVYPETKHPSHFARIGLALEPKLLAVLDAHGWNAADAPVFIQSFEVDNLRRLHRQTRVRLVQLLNPGGRPADDSPRTYAEMATPAGLKDIATYAAGIGANQRLIVPADRAGRLGTPTSLVADAHAAGLLVHVWTLRDDPPFLAAGYLGDPLREHLQFLDLGVDGVFTDFPDTALRARKARRER